MTGRIVAATVASLASGIVMWNLITYPRRAGEASTLPPSVRSLSWADVDTSAWPGYIQHHARTDSLSGEVEWLKGENETLNEVDENLLAALRALTAGMDVLAIENRLIKEYLK